LGNSSDGWGLPSLSPKSIGVVYHRSLENHYLDTSRPFGHELVGNE